MPGRVHDVTLVLKICRIGRIGPQNHILGRIVVFFLSAWQVRFKSVLPILGFYKPKPVNPMLTNQVLTNPNTKRTEKNHCLYSFSTSHNPPPKLLPDFTASRALLCFNLVLFCYSAALPSGLLFFWFCLSGWTFLVCLSISLLLWWRRWRR